MKNKIVSAAQAVAIVRSGDTVACSGFIGIGTPNELILALRERFNETATPRDLTLLFAASPGDGKGHGLDNLACEGLVKRVVGGHYGLVPELATMAVEGRIEAYNLPQGTITQLYRDIAGNRAGTITKVGLRTFVDPRQEGGKINSRTTQDLVRLMEIDGQEWLFYRAFPVSVALIRGTTADLNGNITMVRATAGKARQAGGGAEGAGQPRERRRVERQDERGSEQGRGDACEAQRVDRRGAGAFGREH